MSALFDGVQVQAYIISSLKKEMPSVFGKDSKKKELINNLGEIYLKIEKEHGISPGDFPNLSKMQVSSGVSSAQFTDGAKSSSLKGSGSFDTCYKWIDG